MAPLCMHRRLCGGPDKSSSGACTNSWSSCAAACVKVYELRKEKVKCFISFTLSFSRKMLLYLQAYGRAIKGGFNVVPSCAPADTGSSSVPVKRSSKFENLKKEELFIVYLCRSS